MQCVLSWIGHILTGLDGEKGVLCGVTFDSSTIIWYLPVHLRVFCCYLLFSSDIWVVGSCQSCGLTLKIRVRKIPDCDIFESVSECNFKTLKHIRIL